MSSISIVVNYADHEYAIDHEREDLASMQAGIIRPTVNDVLEDIDCVVAKVKAAIQADSIRATNLAAFEREAATPLRTSPEESTTPQEGETA